MLACSKFYIFSKIINIIKFDQADIKKINKVHVIYWFT